MRRGVVHLASALAVGLVVLVVLQLSSRGWEVAVLGGWVGAGLIFLVWTWVAVWPMDADATARLAQAEDPTRSGSDLAVVGAAVVSLVAVALVVFRGHEAGLTPVVLGVASVVVAWALVHTVFTLRYTRQFYGDPVGGIDFGSDEHPTYRDFAYLSFTVGMTFQVSDTNVTSSDIRATVLRQALISYLFGVVIIAVTVNVLVGLGSG